MSSEEKKLARAKAYYLALCDIINACHPVLSGTRKGHWRDWKFVEKQMFLGKEFFKDIKGINELVTELKNRHPTS